MSTVEINTERLRYLLSLYGMVEAELLDAVNEGLKRPFAASEVLSDVVDLRVAKRIDKVFGRGLAFYTDPAKLPVSRSMSVFFRKKAAEGLNFAAKKVVTDYEGMKAYLSSLNTLMDIGGSPDVQHFTTDTDPREAASEARAAIYPKCVMKRPRDLVKGLFDTLSDHGVTAFEHMEPANKKDKANLDGFFLSPGFIVVSRCGSYEREAFTLAHEVGHLVLGSEDVDGGRPFAEDPESMEATERWCNDFAYHFLVGDMAGRIDGIARADASNDYCHDIVGEVSRRCHISRVALFTRLLYDGKMSRPDYRLVVGDLSAAKPKPKSDGRARIPQRIYAKSFLQTVSVAYYSGAIRDYDLYMMKLPPKVINGLERWL